MMLGEFIAKLISAELFKKKKSTEKERIDGKKVVAACLTPITPYGFCAHYVAKDNCSKVGKCDRQRKL